MRFGAVWIPFTLWILLSISSSFIHGRRHNITVTIRSQVVLILSFISYLTNTFQLTRAIVSYVKINNFTTVAHLIGQEQLGNLKRQLFANDG